ncbi:hypothetical protein BDV95DRAFT_521905 [Massariosphaeria phaeospora]|uniref:Mmc1 C-terminal domain-containing protein n=1 Tax=Massariosphaeria phaeospora TaxID=100035 RepID=A0A7C8IAA4_9PLEO|nr:hypothetical protein BDV95DRAFT_521905 [Massariosphaeria phaeospora]
MPPWVAFVPRLSSFLKARGINPISTSFRYRNATVLRLSRLNLRCASTHISPTAINYRPNIPPRNEDIHNALSELGGSAAAYVNISRLQLALRGLATQDAATRIAVLGLNGQLSAQKLARLLLADPLGAEGQWERELGDTSDEDGRALLLRFGDETDARTPSPLYRTLSIPSRILQTHNLEVLVSTLNISAANVGVSSTAENSKDAVLVPKVETTSTKGLPVPYPVHKSLVLGEGIDSAVAYGRFTSDLVDEAGNMIKVAFDLPPTLEESTQAGLSACSMVNVAVGTRSLDKFRESITNSQIYEQGWFRSGMPILSQWLVQDLQPSDPIHPAMKAMIKSIVDDVVVDITKEESRPLSSLTTSTTPQEIAKAVLGHLEDWAEKSHTELRDQLDEAFTSRNWHKLSWWKLFWRVDDVSMITSEILERRWLVDAEKDAIYLAGRMSQAGFPQDVQYTSDEPVQDQPTLPDEIETPKTDVSTEVRQPQPWPSQIATGRAELLDATIPALQALAQRLVLTTFSTTSLSSAISALLYVSVSSFSVFEASAVAALGLTFSLRRMQNLWESSREMWQAETREEGRKTLKHTEDVVRMIIRRSQKPQTVEDDGVQQRMRARESVEKVREALRRM